MRTLPSPFGPIQQQAGKQAVQRILEDLEMHSIDVETAGMFTRIRRTDSGEVSETVWKGRLLHVRQVADAREYFQRLSRSYAGD